MNEIIAILYNMADSQPLLALLLFLLTAILIALGAPGVIIPLSFAGGALLGGWLGSGIVISGAVLGSQIFFLCARKLMQRLIREKFGKSLAELERELDRRGFVHVVFLRLFGVPHALVTAASAVSTMKGGLFATATLIGILPVVALTACAGAAL